MLEQMRQKGASTLIYLIFGGLIVIFVITPLSGPGDIGCSTSSSVVVDVDGGRVNENSYKIAYSNPFNGFPGRQKVYFALDTAIRRELLASAAEDHGIRVTQDMVTEEIMKGFFFAGGERQDLGQMIFDIDADGDRSWNLNKFRGLVRSLDVSQNAYLDEQQRGLQATLMAELLASSAQVSRDEALSEYLFDNTTVSYDVITFAPALYRTSMLLTEADAERFLAAHEDQVKARHQEKEREYLGRKPELKLRQIFIAKADPAAGSEGKKPDEQKPAGAKKADEKKAEKDPGDGDTTRPAGMPIEEAKARLEAARDAVASGKQKFPELARQLNTEPALKASGGYVGWKTAESASLGEKVVSDAVKELKPGEMTQVIATDRGVYLVMAEDQREKDLTYDQVKHEIAAELAREVWSKEAAKRDALKALETARASGKKLDELYPREVKPGFNLQELQRQINDPSLDPQIRQILQQQLQQQIQLQLGGGDDHGSILTFESPDVPAAWKPGDGDSAGATGAPGDAAAPAPAPLAPSTDLLPAFHGLPEPKVRKEGPHPRQKRLPGVDEAGVKALFDELAKDQLAGRVFEADGNYTVVQVTDKTQAKIEDFEKDAARIIDRMREERGAQLVRDWLKNRCEELDKAGKIKPRADKIAEFDDKGRPLPAVYRPCMSLR
jgi:hypothetical protein